MSHPRTITPSGARIVVVNDGFKVVCTDETIADVLWLQVTAIFAYTRFIEGLGSLCLAFVLPPDKRGREDQVVVNETVGGWNELVSILPSVFASLDKEWVRKASCDEATKNTNASLSSVVPKFVANPTEVWRR